MNKILAISILLSVSGAGFCADDAAKTFPAAGISGLSVETGAGNILVNGAAGDIKVEVTDNDPAKCLITMKTDAGTLVLRAENKPEAKAGGWKRFFSTLTVSHGDGCRAGFKVAAPAALPLKAENGSGGITVSGRDADVHVENGSGPISVEKISGNLYAENGSGGISGSCCAKSLVARTGSGGVSLTGLCGPADAEAGSGNITMDWSGVPASGKARAETGSGNIKLTFPDSAKLAAKLETGSGHVFNDFASDGKFPVEAEAGSGSITLRKAGK